MSKSTEFNNVLDECLDRLLVENETVEQCLQRFPQHSSELKPLLETVLAARQVSAVQPRTEFRDRARYQFNSALREMAQKKSRPLFSWGWQPRWVTTVAIILILSLVGGGTVAAASASMPDNPLYGVKTATEQVQLALTFSELSKAELQARLADKRVTEIAYLAEKGKPEKIAEISENLNAHLGKISVLVAAPAVASAPAVAPAPVFEKAAVTREAPQPQPATVPATPTTPATPIPRMPAPVPEAAAIQKEAVALQKEEQAAKKELSSQGEDRDKKEGEEKRPKDGRRAKLKTDVESQAKENIARLRALLETASESAKPALKRALELAETEYKKAIESLD